MPRGDTGVGRNAVVEGNEAAGGEPLPEVRSIPWYHSIRLGPVVTPGFCPPSVERWTAAALPEDLRGKAVLDIGAWDGYFSFEAERRGAGRVLAIDSLQGRDSERGTAGFQYARKVLGSKVEFRVMDMMDLGELDETFDVVLFLGVYYHLADPIHALRLVFDQLRPGGLVVMEGLVVPGSEPKLRLLGPDDLEPTTFCVATLPWLRVGLQQAGFDAIQVVKGTWRVGDALEYYQDTIPSVPGRLAFAVGNRVAWGLGLTRLPWAQRVRTFRGSTAHRVRRVKMYRALIRAAKPS